MTTPLREEIKRVLDEHDSSVYNSDLDYEGCTDALESLILTKQREAVEGFAVKVKAIEIYKVYGSNPPQGRLGDIPVTVPLPNYRVREEVILAVVIDELLATLAAGSGE